MNKLSSDRMGVKETFTDKGSKKVRQNEITLHIEDMKNVLTAARNAGFIYNIRYTNYQTTHINLL